MSNLSQEEIDLHFNAVQEQTEIRWNRLTKDLDFPSYSSEKVESSIIQEFQQLNSLRMQILSNALFQAPLDLLSKGSYRQKSCVTFAHSSTDSLYNCSSLKLGKRRFFALEGPKDDSVPYFLQLLKKWEIAYLVCLTDQVDTNGNSLCFPYWNGRMFHQEERRFLSLAKACEASRNVPYLFLPEWMDSQGVDPCILLKAATAIRRETIEKEIIAVHCSAGVGRTGTFIAAVCLLDEIDKQLAEGISPNQIQIKIGMFFMYLNFHRPWMIATYPQYITLYKTVDLYIRNHQS